MKQHKITWIIPVLGALVLMVLAEGCTSNKEKRPSPPASDSTILGGVKLKIDYSSPAVKERKIWGELVPYNEVWRTGANKATILELSDSVKIEGLAVPAGKYALFTIPTDSIWTIILNSEWDQWGAYNYDASRDVARFSIAPEFSEFDERMTFKFEQNQLTFNWENVSYRLNITPATFDAGHP